MQLTEFSANIFEIMLPIYDTCTVSSVNSECDWIFPIFISVKLSGLCRHRGEPEV